MAGAKAKDGPWPGNRPVILMSAESKLTRTLAPKKVRRYPDDTLFQALALMPWKQKQSNKIIQGLPG